MRARYPTADRLCSRRISLSASHAQQRSGNGAGHESFGRRRRMSLSIPVPTDRALRRLGIDPDVIAGRTLPFFADIAPAELVVAEIEEGGKQHRLAQPAAAAWATMKQ